MSEKSKIVYVTKYALTEGITKERVRETSFPEMVSTFGEMAYSTGYHKPDWHDTEAEARERVSVMIKRKIASVQRQLDKLKRLDAETMPIKDQTKSTKAPSLPLGPE